MIIDVSKFQGNIDWKKLKNAGVEVAFLKTTQGIGYKDPDVSQDSLLAKTAGVKIGYYHFASLNDHDEVKDAQSEAKYFVSILKNLPKPDMPLILDIEENKAGLNKDEILVWIKTFFAQLVVSGYTDYAIYSYAPFLNENLPENHGLGNIKLWLAAYTVKPSLPKGWSSFYLWQFSSKGKIDGIKGNVDLSRKVI